MYTYTYILTITLFVDNLDATEIPERTNVTKVANLVGVPVQSLIDALTRKTIFAHGETVVSFIFNSNLYLINSNILTIF